MRISIRVRAPFPSFNDYGHNGNGKRSQADRSRFFQIARGSALECAAVLDELRIMKGIAGTEVEEGKELLFRIVSMLSKMTVPARENGVHEDSPDYEVF